MSRTKTHWMHSRRDRLTKAQEANLPAVCEKWRQIVLSTQPADRKRAHEALNEAYRAFHRRPPKVIWLDSIFKLTEELSRAQQTRLRFTTRWGGVAGAVELGALRFYKSQVVKDLQRMIDASVPGIISQLRLLPRDERDFTQQWVGGIAGSYLGTDTAQALAIADFLATERHREFHIFSPVLQHCAGVFIYEKSALLLERPRVLNIDQHNRLHSLEGPALEYRDGSVVHAIHGIRVDRKWIDTPADEIDIADVMQEQNAGVRGALIAKLGFERLLKKARYRTISRYRSNSLIEFTFPGRQWISPEQPDIATIRLRALYLKWQDKTGRKETVLPVPRTLRQFGVPRSDANGRQPRLNVNSCEQVRRWTLGWPREAVVVAET